MNFRFSFPVFIGLLLSFSLLLQSCNSSGGSGLISPVNVDPVITATPVTLVSVGNAYSFQVTATDSNLNDTLTFSLLNNPAWMSLTITGTNRAVISGTPLVADVGTVSGIGISVTDSAGGGTVLYFDVTVTNCVTGTGPAVTISGTVTFDRVPQKTAAHGLDYNAITQQPARGVIVEAICQTVTTTTTDASGNYSLTMPGNTTGLFIRVKAQMLQTGLPAWNFSVVDNMRSKALYAMDSSTFDVGTVNPAPLNLRADSGWTGSSYGNMRVAAPFAILDTIYTIKEKILDPAVAPLTVFQPLKLNWNKNNIASPGNVNPALGRLETTGYDPNTQEIFILGKENVDTDEYDEHILVHEWAHYFEDSPLSRSDSIGWSHTFGDVLDIRVAYSEGFGNAFSAMILDEPLYRDSNGTGQSLGLGFDIDNNTCTNPGWYSECSVQAILYDLYDAPSVGDDDLSTLGLAPIYNVLINEQKSTDAMTSLFSFIHPLRLKNVAETDSIDALVGAQNIDQITDIYGDSELTNNPGATNVLPVHSYIEIGGPAVNVCSTGENKGFNGLGVFRFLKFSTTGGPVTIKAVRTSGLIPSDPDIDLFHRGQLIDFSDSTVVNTESFVTVSLAPGNYVIQVYEYTYTDLFYSGAGQTCFNVTVN
ncbi:MAG: hypothetical protein OEY87_07725 [Gammaproteobacteria bacterium]|nr:hypothetical protein [Gammaproteobacteria bacterium]MDH5735996.1 hypothetical protein [Gammaproteobacteria bacterium]